MSSFFPAAVLPPPAFGVETGGSEKTSEGAGAAVRAFDPAYVAPR
jgi:hypothetical protein